MITIKDIDYYEYSEVKIIALYELRKEYIDKYPENKNEVYKLFDNRYNIDLYMKYNNWNKKRIQINNIRKIYYYKNN